MDYSESAALMTDPTFRGRIKVSALKYGDSIVIAATPVADHTSLVKWAFRCFQMPDTIAMELQPLVVEDPAVQAAGAAIDDVALQGAVEAAVRKVA
jgi:hypothetical protein